MRTKRITTLMLSGLMALSTVGLTATAVSADYDEHANIVVQVALRIENIDVAGNNWRKANQSQQLLRDIRHFHRDHRVPRFVTKMGCRDDFADLIGAARSLARHGFVYYRGKATRWQEYPAGWQRQNVRVRQSIIHNRIEDRYGDAQDDFLDCVFDALPRRARGLFF